MKFWIFWHITCLSAITIAKLPTHKNSPVFLLTLYITPINNGKYYYNITNENVMLMQSLIQYQKENMQCKYYTTVPEQKFPSPPTHTDFISISILAIQFNFYLYLSPNKFLLYSKQSPQKCIYIPIPSPSEQQSIDRKIRLNFYRKITYTG